MPLNRPNPGHQAQTRTDPARPRQGRTTSLIHDFVPIYHPEVRQTARQLVGANEFGERVQPNQHLGLRLHLGEIAEGQGVDHDLRLNLARRIEPKRQDVLARLDLSKPDRVGIVDVRKRGSLHRG